MSNAENLLDLGKIIAYLEVQADDTWMTGVCMSKDHTKKCIFAHLYHYAGGDANQKVASQFLDYFEECVATTYMLFSVNDGNDPRYPQATPALRCVAYLKDLRDHKEPTSSELWDLQGNVV